MLSKRTSRTGWPSTELCLLLKAYACPVDQARAAWRGWLATRTVDNASWAEVRLLAALAGRIAIIDPQSAELSRLEGVRRFVWTSNQVRLDRSMSLIDLLIKSGIPVMLLKGMARIATNPALASARFVRDIDIIVESSRLDEACEILITNGWRPVFGKLPGLSRAEPFGRLLPEIMDKATVEEENFHVDVHRSAVHYGRTGTFDDNLWTHCRDAVLRGRPVKIPSETDQFLHAIAHGTISDAERPADWVIDALDAATGSGFSWEICASEILRRRMGAAVSGGFCFLESELGFWIPAEIWRIVKRDGRNLLYRTEVEIYRQLPKDRTNFGRKCLRWAEWFRSRHCLYQPQQQRQTFWKGGQELDQTEQAEAAARRIPLTTPIADYVLSTSDLRNDWQIMIDVEVTGGTERYVRLDLLLDGTWFGRIRLELRHPEDRKMITRRFLVTVPQALVGDVDNCNVRLVLVNSKGSVPAVLPYGISIGLSPPGRAVVEHRARTLREMFPDNDN